MIPAAQSGPGSDNGEVYVLNGKSFEELHSGLEFNRKGVWGIGEDASGNLYISSESGGEMFAIDSNSGVVSGTGKVVTEKVLETVRAIAASLTSDLHS